jgi:AcrR family transcriptional regulator
MSQASTKKQPRDTKSGYSVGRRTRADIVNAACHIIAKQGYEALTASALAARAGISKGGLYHHFGRMSDVVVAAYEATAQSIVGELKTSSPESFDDYLCEVERVIFDRLLTKPKTLRIVSELYPRIMFDPQFKSVRQSSFNNMVDVMSAVLAESLILKIDEDELRMAIRSVGVFLIGLVVQHGVNRDADLSRAQWRWFKASLNARLESLPNEKAS